jgi:hypothetical protein
MKQKRKRLSPLEIATKNASFNILGLIIERLKKTKQQ